MASVALPHDENGYTTADYWLAWPPFIDEDTLTIVLRRRFRSALSAMDYADRTWPIELVRGIR